jgi:hypothetical protein
MKYFILLLVLILIEMLLLCAIFFLNKTAVETPIQSIAPIEQTVYPIYQAVENKDKG